MCRHVLTFSTRCFAKDDEEINVPNFITHVQSIDLLVKPSCFMTSPLPSPSYLLNLPNFASESSLQYPGYQRIFWRAQLDHY